MAKVSSKNATILIGGYALSPYATSYEINPGLESLDVTGFTEGGINYIPDIANGEINLNMFWDSAANSANAALSALGTKAVTIIPETYAVGGDAFSMLATQTNWNPSGGASGPLVCDGVNFKGTGGSGAAVMAGQIIQHATITATTTGSNSRDWTEAAITAPCVGILHIWTPCAADTYVVTIEHSANGSSGWATLLTFTANGSARASELVAVASGTINQYRRVVATRNGSAANPFGFSVFFWRKNA